MLVKKAKPTYKRVFGIALTSFVAVEALAFAVSYGLWYKLNTERDFRLYMHNNHNWVLQGYYKVGEFVADQKTRELDHKVWTQEGKI